MTIDELIERLEEYRDELGGDARVLLMTQQQWPFENEICGIVSAEEINHSSDEDDQDVEEEGVVYIVEGGQLRYGTKRAWDILGR
jgi:hypothetical protein